MLFHPLKVRKGGIRLGREAQDISLFDVVCVADENFAMAECFENDATDCPLVDSCALNSSLREALNAFFAVLMKYSIADMVKARPNVRALLGIDEPEAERLVAKACRDLSDSLLKLSVVVFTHAVIPKPVPTFGRHALDSQPIFTERISNVYRHESLQSEHRIGSRF